jgi:hypothetical protein
MTDIEMSGLTSGNDDEFTSQLVSEMKKRKQAKAPALCGDCQKNRAVKKIKKRRSKTPNNRKDSPSFVKCQEAKKNKLAFEALKKNLGELCVKRLTHTLESEEQQRITKIEQELQRLAPFIEQIEENRRKKEARRKQAEEEALVLAQQANDDDDDNNEEDEDIQSELLPTIKEEEELDGNFTAAETNQCIDVFDEFEMGQNDDDDDEPAAPPNKHHRSPTILETLQEHNRTPSPLVKKNPLTAPVKPTSPLQMEPFKASGVIKKALLTAFGQETGAPAKKPSVSFKVADLSSRKKRVRPTSLSSSNHKIVTKRPRKAL